MDERINSVLHVKPIFGVDAYKIIQHSKSVKVSLWPDESL